MYNIRRLINGGYMKEKYTKIFGLFKNIGILHYEKNYHSLDKIGLYPGQPVVIEMISSNEGINQRDLANLVCKKASTVNIMLDRLVRADIVVKKGDSVNKRITRLYLTDKGKELEEKIKKIHNEMMDIYFKDISMEEIFFLEKICEKIKNNLENK